MSTRGRIWGFGSAGLLILVGVACVLVFGGGTGQLLAVVLISLGFVLATSLVFFEVGLSEDREHERERERAQRASRPGQIRRPVKLAGGRSLGRMRGRRRRLR